MENYNKWRRLVFEAAAPEFDWLGKHSQCSKSDDEVRIDIKEPFDDYLYGIVSCNTNSFDSFFNKNTGICPAVSMGLFRDKSSISATRNLYNDADQRNKLLVGFGATNAHKGNPSINEGFVITIEGIIFSRSEQKKKFLFVDGDLEMQTTFATFKSMFEKGYKFDGRDLVLYPSISPEESSLSGLYVKDDLRVLSFRNYFNKVLPRLVNIYKENEELYRKAIIEINGNPQEYDDEEI